MSERVSRRTVLQGLAGCAGALAVDGATDHDSGAESDESGDAHTGDEDRIPAPFDQMPVISDPTDSERRIAGVSLPAGVVPDEGPIPDYHHIHTVTREIVAPEWALEAARWRLRHNDPDEIDRWRVREFLTEYAYIDEQYVTPDGRDAVEAVLAALD